MNLIAYALQARARGFHVFPVEPNEKTPHTLTPGQPYTLRWGEAATNNLGRIIDYWRRWPDSNIGVACKPSGLIVVDCDIPKREYQLTGTQYAGLHDSLGPLVDGTDVFRHVCESLGGSWAEAYDTYRVCTGSLGCHYYYLWPQGIRSAEASQASIVKGLVDIRCNAGEWGGYVLGAGSVTTKGAYLAENAAPVRPAPGWLVELCRRREPVRVSSPFRQPGRTGALSGLIATVEQATEGNRNQALLWAARAACADGVPLDDVLEPLSDAYAAAQGDGGHRQAEATIRSAYRLQGRTG
ncbi:bifunctional DNA primase/polymerase [Streptomyces sp. NPDC026659]|uniref:bifunctional DNA primase/polymerase n=1 Tax=Streptomyces sp. NPDC026659 TaxID=3155123 RepID=UPI0033CCDFB7